MIREDISRVEPKNIICLLEVEGKEYCAFTTDDDPEYVNFGLVSELEGNAKMVSEIPESDLEKVLAEYDKYMEFMASNDELDDESEDE